MKPTQERLKELFHYDFDSGKFIRIIKAGNQIPGERAGSLKKDGYRVIDINHKKYGEHRLAWLYMTGSWPLFEIDHIDTNRSNNKWTNLREATKAQNKHNSSKRSDSGFKYKGLKKERNGRVAARIYVDNKQIYLGCYSSEEEASAAYAEAAKRYFGEYSRAV